MILKKKKKNMKQCFLCIIICNFEKKFHSREEKFHAICINLDI